MKSILAALCAICIGSATTAQEFHGGLSAEYAQPHSGKAQSGVSWLGGVTFRAADLRYGLELDLGTPLGGDVDYDTNRLRLIGLYDIGDYEILGSIGATRYQFSDETTGGSNFGIGIQGDLTDRYTLRAEFIRDIMTDNITAAVTTSRIAVIYNF